MTTPPRDNPHSDSGDPDESVLQAAGLNPRPFWRDFHSDNVLTVIALLVSVFIVWLNLDPKVTKAQIDAATGVATAIALAVSYRQWRAARHENSFDKYYDRLDIANQQFDEWRRELSRANPAELQGHLNTMFIFSELDNLEYILEKYQLGYVRKRMVKRALRTFRSRCENTPGFSEGVFTAGSEQIQNSEHRKATKNKRVLS